MKRYEALEAYEKKENAAIHGMIEDFVHQPDVAAEIEDLEGDVMKEFMQMEDRFEQFMNEHDKYEREFEHRVYGVLEKMEDLDRKFKANVKFDPETKLFKVSTHQEVLNVVQAPELEAK